MTRLFLVLCAALLAAACGPDCKKGHDDLIKHHSHYETRYHTIYVGKRNTIQVPYQELVPEWTETRFVCDEYARTK